MINGGIIRRSNPGLSEEKGEIHPPEARSFSMDFRIQ
jgi:hypothetical protein